MAIRKVLKIGDETLRKKSFTVTEIDAKLHHILDGMKEHLIK